MSQKFLHILLLLVLLVAIIEACSSDAEMEPVVEPPLEEEGLAITFSGAKQEEQAVTRVATPLESYSTNFTVWGFKNKGTDLEPYSSYQTVFSGYQVQWTSGTEATTTTNTHGWEYILPSYPAQTIKYWDYSSSAYRFFGVTGNQSGTVVARTAPFASYEPQEAHTTYRVSFAANAKTPATVPYYSHLWFSTGQLPTYAGKEFGEPVVLEFLQPLSQVRFMFVSADPDVPLSSYELSGANFRPVDSEKHITTEGTFTLSYPLTGSATTENWTMTPTADGYISAFTKAWETDADWVSVLPARDQGPYLLTVRVNGEEKPCSVPEQFMNWQPGYKYTYVFKVKGDLGVELGHVSSAYTDWVEGEEADYTVYNW